MGNDETCTIELSTGTRIEVARPASEVAHAVAHVGGAPSTMQALPRADVPDDTVYVDLLEIVAVYPDGRAPAAEPTRVVFERPHETARAIFEVARRYRTQ